MKRNTTSLNLKSTVPIAVKPQPNQSVFDALPDSAFVREAQLVQSPKRPTTPVPLPFSAPTLWRKVAAKTFPAPTKISERVTVWNVGLVRAWMAQQSSQDYTPTGKRARKTASTATA